VHDNVIGFVTLKGAWPAITGIGGFFIGGFLYAFKAGKVSQFVLDSLNEVKTDTSATNLAVKELRKEVSDISHELGIVKGKLSK